MKNKTYLKIILCLCAFSIISSSSLIFSAEKEGEVAKKAEDDGMTKEGQAALVAASTALQANDFATAEKTLTDYLATNPVYKPEVLYSMLGVALYNQQKFSEAANIFKTAFEMFPTKTDYFINQATVTYEGGKFIEAAALFEKAYDIIPGADGKKEPEYLKKAAACYYQGENLEEAKRMFIKIAGLSKEPDAEIIETIYSICKELGQKDEERKYLFQLMAFNPAKKEYWLLMANMYMEENNYENIAASLEIAYALQSPEKKSDLKSLQDLYTYLNVPLRLTKNIVNNSQRFSPDSKDNAKVINGYLTTFRTDKAVAFIDEVNAKKKDIDLMLQKANILLESRKNKEAIKAADDIIAIDPNKGLPHMIKAYAAWDMEDWKASKDALLKASNFKEYKDLASNLIGVIESLEEAKAAMEEAVAEAAAAKKAENETEIVPVQ